MTDALPTFDELRREQRGWVGLEGPNSGGGRTLIFARGQAFLVVYGDESTLPGGAEQVVSAVPLDAVERAYGKHPHWAQISAVLASLR